MWVVVIALAVLLGACGGAGRPSAATASPVASLAPSASGAPQSAAAAAIGPLARAVPFQLFVPTALPAHLPVTVSLRAATLPKDRTGIGDPVLWVEVQAVPGGKPALHLLEGPEGCCADVRPATPGRSVIVRTTPTEVRGELFASQSVNEGPTLRYVDGPAAGPRTTIVITTYAWGSYATEEALLELARSMAGVTRQPRGDAVLLYYSTHVSHSPTGHRISVAVRSAPAPESARLLDTSGRVISSARFEVPKSYECLRAAAAVAALQVSEPQSQEIGRGSLRVEVLVTGSWLPTQLVASNCASIE